MATVNYSVHESPTPRKEEKKRYHVRPVSNRAIKTEQLITDISNMSSFSGSDVKGLLEAFSTVMKRYLMMGGTVELEGIGMFSISLDCPKDVEDPSKIRATDIRFKKVNFKSSASLNSALTSMKFIHSKDNTKGKQHTEEERLKRILDFIRAEGSIQSSACMGLNNCTRYIALKDLGNLAASGKIIQRGNRASSIYLLA